MMNLRYSGKGDVTARKNAATAEKRPACCSTRAAMANLEPINMATNMQEKETEIAKHSSKYEAEGNWD